MPDITCLTSDALSGPCRQGRIYTFDMRLRTLNIRCRGVLTAVAPASTKTEIFRKRPWRDKGRAGQQGCEQEFLVHRTNLSSDVHRLRAFLSGLSKRRRGSATIVCA